MVDITNASTESFLRYHYFHEQFNSTVQIALAGMITLRSLVNNKNGSNILNSLVLSTEIRATDNPRTSQPIPVIDKAIFNQGQLCIVEAVSAFDSFTIDFISNLAQFSPALRGAGSPFNHAHTSVVCDHSNPVEFCKCCQSCAVQYAKNHKLGLRIVDLCNDLGICDADIIALLPIFNYFRLSRNCIVHYGGRAHQELPDLSQSADFEESVKFWNRITKRDAPKLPKFSVGEQIKLTMESHAILCSAVCYKIAKNLNQQTAPLLGIDGIIHMAAFYSLFTAFHEYRSDKYYSTHAPISRFLSRYRIQNIQRDYIIQTAKRLGIWKDIVKRVKALYPNIKF